MKKPPKRLQPFWGRQGQVSMKHLSLKFTLFIGLFFLPVVFSGCFNCNCGKSTPPPETFYDTIGLSGKVTCTNSTWCYYSSTSLDILPQMRYYVAVPDTPKSICSGSLYACSCNEYDNYGRKGTSEKVVGIQITSNKEFKTGYPAGKNLAELMLILPHYYQANQSFNRVAIDSFLASTPFAPYRFELFFNTAPDTLQAHIFTIRYQLNNGEIHTYATSEITFQ